MPGGLDISSVEDNCNMVFTTYMSSVTKKNILYLFLGFRQNVIPTIKRSIGLGLIR